MLPHNISQGVIISNHSLVLQGVSRATAGNYSCVGFNAEGDGISPPFTLNVLCKFFIILKPCICNTYAIKHGCIGKLTYYSLHLTYLLRHFAYRDHNR